jgi:hypothetical protein
MLYNRREHWAEGGLSADKFGPSDLQFGTHGLPSIDLTGGHLFGDIQDTWSPAFVNWTPTSSTSDSSEFSVSPTIFNHWDLTLTGTPKLFQFAICVKFSEV